jgi:hypothetical protein
LLTIVESSSGPARGMTAERVVAHTLVDLGYDVTLIGGRNRGHDLVASKGDSGELLVDCKALTAMNSSERKQCEGRYKIYCREHRGWGSDGRTHLGLVALPVEPTTVTYDGVTCSFSVPVAGAEVYLVPLEEMNEGLEPHPGWDYLWLDDDWLTNYRM